jgi:hypothetical protein
MTNLKKTLSLLLKLVVSFGLLGYVVWQIGREADWDNLVARIGWQSLGWIGLAFLAQAIAMGFTIVRWKLLLDGQAMHVPLKHLVGAFLIGRLIGNFAPSTLGLDGYRVYDIAKHSGKISPALSVILVEKVIGFFVLSTLVVATLPWGMGILPRSTLVGIGAMFAVPVLLSILLLTKPSLIQRILGVFFRPGTPVGKKVEKASAAVTTYEAHRGQLVRAVAAGFPVHISNMFVFIFCGLAIGADISLTDMLFVGPLAITAGVLPISLAGLGVREGAFAFLLGKAGVLVSDAGLLALLGRVVGLIISAIGGLGVWIARRAGYKVEITGKAMEREEGEDEASPEAATAKKAPPPLLGPGRHLLLGATAGLLAGALVGMIEMTYILLQIPAPRPWGSLAYAGTLYGLVCAFLGAGLGFALWLAARLAKERAAWLRATPQGLWALTHFGLLCGLGAIIVRFRVFRDLFDEKLRMMSLKGLGVQFLIVLALGTLFIVGFRFARRALAGRSAGWLLRAWGPPAVAAGLVTLGLVAGLLSSARPSGATPSDVTAPPDTPNVVFVMIDTLRADEVGAYNSEARERVIVRTDRATPIDAEHPERGQTPNIDRLAAEGVVFEQAFAQASWTKPSVASVLTGRYPSSHNAVQKNDALPSEAETIAELLHARGFATAGIVTNYNLAPDFNFQQGFEDYVYLTPRYFLGADDTTAKLALYQTFRLVHERFFAGGHDVDRYYQDARRTTDEALAWLDRRRDDARPFFLWVQYMDPHDPYFPHDGGTDVVGHAITAAPPAEQRDRILDVYRQEIQFTDEHVGRLFDGLRSRGLMDRSVVVVWADHGEEFLDHGDWWHGTTLYDEQVHVPLILRPPRAERPSWNQRAFRPGVRLAGWVSLIDLPYTILREAGYTPEELAAAQHTGNDLFHPWAPGTTPTVYSEEDHQGNVLRALRYRHEDGDTYKLIEAPNIVRPGLRPTELYEVHPSGETRDLTADVVARREQEDVSAAAAAPLAWGRTQVEDLERIAKAAALAREPASGDVDVQRLQMLGYDRGPQQPNPPDAGR